MGKKKSVVNLLGKTDIYIYAIYIMKFKAEIRNEIFNSNN
jgi:hypothetical protein